MKKEIRKYSEESEIGLFLRLLNTILGTAAATLLDTHTVERATNDVVTHTRKVLHTTTANEHDTVLLQVVPFIRDVGDHFNAISQTNLRHLADSRVWLFRCAGHDLHTNATAEWVLIQSTRLGLFLLNYAWGADELVNCRHEIRSLDLEKDSESSVRLFLCKDFVGLFSN